jgi:hypothetical protein
MTKAIGTASGYIDRVLKGTNPHDLPVQNPVKTELVINLKTAKALGLTIPDKLRAITDEMIESWASLRGLTSANGTTRTCSEVCYESVIGGKRTCSERVFRLLTRSRQSE